MMANEFPAGKPKETKEYKPDNLGIYKVQNIIHPDLPIKDFPTKNDKGILDWNENIVKKDI